MGTCSSSQSLKLKNIPAYEIIDDSMFDPAGQWPHNSFPQGGSVLYDPQRKASLGDYVIAEHEGKRVFRKLVSAGGEQALLPMNPDRDEFPVVTQNFQILGRVFQINHGPFPGPW
ncbi:LexA family protein [Parahaliea mediterranea]|uniref:LexA family protein n=1 Tax=Parahaliea mediterranea TaxID=651086 RepID=UPI000E2FA005|nr:S24 family peptidase [Parahaliea mediterranea]